MRSNDLSFYWIESIKQIRDDELISNQEFDMWFTNMNYVSSSESSISVSVPSKFYKYQVKKRYLDMLEDALFRFSDRRITLEFKIVQMKELAENNNTEASTKKGHIKERILSYPQLREDYTFKNFIVGNNNIFATNAAKSISDNPGSLYNPCLIYGGVGMGKTHLMQSIGNAILKKQNGQKIVYISAEIFVAEFVQSLRNKTQHAFKNRYRKNVDILLIDDIHEFHSKEGIQDELFHTFNALYDANKQMVFSSVRPPSEFENFANRLKSRFKMGLNVGLQPPNYETRRAILKNMNAECKIDIPDDVMEMICENITTNIRDLKATLIQIIAYADLVGQNITMEIAQNQLKQAFYTPIQANITIDRVQRIVSEYFNIGSNILQEEIWTKEINLPDQISMYIIREFTSFSILEISLAFGGIDQSIIMKSCQQVESRMNIDPAIELIVMNLIRFVGELDNYS